jgi:hypothetical protein
MNRALELEHLRKAEQDIANGRERIMRQNQLIEGLERHGHDATTAKALLSTMHASLSVMEEHRVLIMKELDIAAAGRAKASLRPARAAEGYK